MTNREDYSDDPAVRIANAIQQSLSLFNETALSSVNSRLVNRLTSAKSLPSFSGDPLDCVRFPQAFNMSTDLGEYSDRENITRLFEALKGEALNASKIQF